jgi:hypothetical protein
MNKYLKLSLILQIFLAFFLLFPSESLAAAEGGPCDDLPVSECRTDSHPVSSPLNLCNSIYGPPQNSCNQAGDWNFEYATSCLICNKLTIAGPACNLYYVYQTTICSAADRCLGSDAGGGTGYNAEGKIAAGNCDASHYDGVNPITACVSGGWYKTCCKTQNSQITNQTVACKGQGPGISLCSANGGVTYTSPTTPPAGNGCPTPVPPVQCNISVGSGSPPAGVRIEVSGGTPASGSTPFTVNAPQGSSVTLTAPDALPGIAGSTFDRWEIRDGGTLTATRTTRATTIALNQTYCNRSATAYYNIPSKYYYCKVSDKSCAETFDSHPTKQDCETFLSTDLPGQTTGVCYSINDLSNCQTDCSAVGGNQTFYRCNNSNSCVSAGQYADQAACETSQQPPVTCYANSNCGNNECDSSYHQFYRCDGSNCKPAGRYKKKSECEAVYDAGKCYREDSACNNECGTTYWCNNANPNLCMSGATCPSGKSCKPSSCSTECSGKTEYWCDSNNQCQSGGSCPDLYKTTCKINSCPSQCSSPPARSVYYYCNADTNSCSSQQSTKEECEEEYGICYKQKSDCAEACEKSDPPSGDSKGKKDVSITLEVGPDCIPQNTSADSDDPDYEGIKLNWEVSMKGNVCDQDGLPKVAPPSDWSKCDEISEWQNKTPAGSGECDVAYGYLADWPDPPFSVVKSMGGLADVDPPPAVTKDYALGCQRDEYQCQWRRSCSYSCQKLCDLDCNHCVRKNPCVVADDDTEHKCCDSTCTDFQSELGLVHEGGYQFKKITLGVVQPFKSVDFGFYACEESNPVSGECISKGNLLTKLQRLTNQVFSLDWTAKTPDSGIPTRTKCRIEENGQSSSWSSPESGREVSGSKDFTYDDPASITYGLECENTYTKDLGCHVRVQAPSQIMEIKKPGVQETFSPSIFNRFSAFLANMGSAIRKEE